MPGPIKASEAVWKTRRYCGILGSGAYRDGFSSDASTSTSLVPILDFENIAIRILCDTGIVQGDYTIASVSGQFQYTYPSGMGKLVNMRYDAPISGGSQHRPLRQTTIIRLNSLNRLWEYRGGTPNVYADIGPEFVLFPVPDSASTIRLRGHKLADDLVNPNDYPTVLPHWFHEAYPLLAAIILLSTDDSPIRQDRIQSLKEIFLNLYPDLADIVTARSLILYRTRVEGDSMKRGES